MEHQNTNPLLRDAYDSGKDPKNHITCTWFNFANQVKELLREGNINTPSTPTLREIKKFKQYLKYKYARFWTSALWSDSQKNSVHGKKLRTYRRFKVKFDREKYLDIVKDKPLKQAITKFRVSDHKLMIEVGRHKNIPLEERLCPFCKQEVEDECHFLLVCHMYNDQRKKLLDYISSKSPLFQNLSIPDQFLWLMSSHDSDVILSVGEFIYKGMQHRQTSLAMT